MLLRTVWDVVSCNFANFYDLSMTYEKLWLINGIIDEIQFLRPNYARRFSVKIYRGKNAETLTLVLLSCVVENFKYKLTFISANLISSKYHDLQLYFRLHWHRFTERPSNIEQQQMETQYQVNACAVDYRSSKAWCGIYRKH